MKDKQNEYVIAFQRVSTDSQDIEEQAKQLREFIKKDGFSEEQIITIGEKGASAIKEDEDYMNCINELYETLNCKNIKCVYCWELSRIYRKKKIGDSIIELLKENLINLKIMTPSLYLLDSITGEINAGMELAIALFTTMAEQEMRLKKARFKRSKEKNSREGKSNGGKTTPYGYYVDDNNYFQIKDEEAKVVLMCCEKYATGNYSISKLGVEMRELGYSYINTSWLQRVLSSTIYIGYKKINKNNGQVINRTYPRIISDELYNKVKEQLCKNRSEKSRESKNHFFCTKLIKCSCGRSYTATHSVYKCCGKVIDRTDKTHVCTGEGFGISISLMDGLMWDIASYFEEHKISEIQKGDKEKLESENKELSKKIKNIPTLISKIDDKIEKAALRNIDGKLSDDKFDEVVEKYNREKKELENNLKQYQLQIEFNTNSIKSLKEDIDSFDKLWGAVQHVKKYTEEKKSEIVHKYIREIRLYKVSKKEIIVDVQTIYGYLTVKILPYEQTIKYRTMDGRFLMIEPILRGDRGVAHTLKDLVDWAADGVKLTNGEEKLIKIRDNWMDGLFEKYGKETIFAISFNKKMFFDSLHNNPYNPTL